MYVGQGSLLYPTSGMTLCRLYWLQAVLNSSIYISGVILLARIPFPMNIYYGGLGTYMKYIFGDQRMLSVTHTFYLRSDDGDGHCESFGWDFFCLLHQPLYLSVRAQTYESDQSEAVFF